MNERILSPQLLKLVQDAGPGYSMADPEWVKKFAELIVKECMSVARQQRNPANLNYKPSERFVEDLRQHFGIE